MKENKKNESPLDAYSKAVVDVAERVSPSVVNISVTVKMQTPIYSPGIRQETTGSGSGTIVAPDGFILTNSHVVHNGTRIRVTLNDGSTFSAQLMGEDPATDLAVLRINASGLPTVEMGNSDTLKVGQLVIAIGNHLGFQTTLPLVL